MRKIFTFFFKNHPSLIVIFACLFFCVSVSIAQHHTSNDKPNIIYILVDDMGVGDVGVFYQNQRKNQPRIYTPQLDRMGEQGALLAHSYVNAPVCVASRSSLILGVTQGHTTVRDNQFDKAIEDNYTLANTLKQAGYTTAAIGKWGLQGQGGKKNWIAHPLKRGFDYYYGYIRHSDGHEHYPKEGLYRGTKEVYDNYTNVTPDLDKCYTGDLWTARAKQWIIDHVRKNHATPFFMYLAYDTPHAVIELPTSAYPAGGGLQGGLQWLGKPGKMINTADGNIDSWMDPQYANATYDHDNDPKTPEIPWPDVNKRYATVVSRIDQQVGDLLQLLKDLNIDSNTLVIFTSDNGPSQESYLNEPYTPEFFKGYGPHDGIKRDTWEGGIRVPTIATWPKMINRGTVVTTPHMSSDWMATFLDAAGLKAPARSDGVSILPSLTGKGEQLPTQVYIEYFQSDRTPRYEDIEEGRRGKRRNQMQVIRVGNYMGVRYDIKSASDDFEIYDVVNDPKQTQDLGHTPEMVTIQQLMKERVLQLRKPDSAAPRPYDTAYVPSLKDDIEQQPGQITWKLYQMNTPWVANPAGMRPLHTGHSKILQVPSKVITKDALIVFEGFIDVPIDGAYTFYLQTGGKAFVRIHDIPLIDQDYGYVPRTETSETILLKAGVHPVRVFYKPGSDNSIKLEWSGPDFTRKAVY